MPTCFVIQPFDPEHNKRYEEVYKPALKQAGLEPYRVDQDPTVEVPIESIEKGIRDSAICLADITEDIPQRLVRTGVRVRRRFSCRDDLRSSSENKIAVRYPTPDCHQVCDRFAE